MSVRLDALRRLDELHHLDHEIFTILVCIWNFIYSSVPASTAVIGLERSKTGAIFLYFPVSPRKVIKVITSRTGAAQRLHRSSDVENRPCIKSEP